MKRILLLAVFLTTFILVTQMVVHWWLAEPAPRFQVLAEKGFDVIAHRGGREFAPQSTIEAMQAALDAGTDVLEMDIRQTRDAHLVVFHDATLERTTDCRGLVREKTLAELKRCEKNSGISGAQRSKDSVEGHLKPGSRMTDKIERRVYRVPTLKEVFATFGSERMIIEIKQQDPSLEDAFCSLIRSHHLADQIIVGSFKQQPMDRFRTACPEVATSATPKEATLFILSSWIGLSRLISPEYAVLQIPPELPLPGFLPILDIATPSLVTKAHQKGVAVQVWTINDTVQMKTMLDAGVDGIMTDYPSKLVDILR